MCERKNRVTALTSIDEVVESSCIVAIDGVLREPLRSPLPLKSPKPILLCHRKAINPSDAGNYQEASIDIVAVV
ncbi:unnamed protein product [Prunus armeniaca]|uniref:Uncharacterized protein n=1 Tax=Prunus armeniaca TaxID=36596 RepID=A0A6J5TPA0_PRUAR|nr:unnamed protein product [Prunus armeniaca]